jgi:hypothetical protein
MNEIAVLSDNVAIRKEEERLLFLTLTKEFKIWCIDLKMPDGTTSSYRYEKRSTEGIHGMRISRELSSSGLDKRREIIQEQINRLAQQGFSVSQKYISLFMSNKIKELILTKKKLR